MLATRGYATDGPSQPFRPYDFERRDPGADDLVIAIEYCGICHSDIHQARGEWGPAAFPMVPGHEIVGTIVQTGKDVHQFRVGDRAGIGCFVDTCRTCKSCRDGVEQFCRTHVSYTYNGTEQDQTTPTHGGYSNRIVVDQKYALRVPSGLDPAGAAPLLCAGITTYSPLRAYGTRDGTRVAIMGLGGLGHMGVKLAASMGADVTVLSTSPEKEADARRLGAHDFCLVSESSQRAQLTSSFDLIINTVSANHDIAPVVEMLDLDGTMVIVGAPSVPFKVGAFPLILNRRRVAGSMIGGIGETQEMLDYCGQHGITSDVEVIPIQRIDEAYERTIRGDVRYRFVIDLVTLDEE
jgi:uncharacterized zinc-type alcohol dehydrogenase-like protein